MAEQAKFFLWVVLIQCFPNHHFSGHFFSFSFFPVKNVLPRTACFYVFEKIASDQGGGVIWGTPCEALEERI